jgi:hypothetical protein
MLVKFQTTSKKAKAKRPDFFTIILGFPIQRNAGYKLQVAVAILHFNVGYAHAHVDARGVENTKTQHRAVFKREAGSCSWHYNYTAIVIVIVFVCKPKPQTKKLIQTQTPSHLPCAVTVLRL